MAVPEITFPGLEGGEIRLADHRGRALLVANTASQCGFTPQYAGLQELWRRYRGRGLAVVGVPSNDFGEQEPGGAEEIRTFCTRDYGVDFPLAAKQPVIGEAAHPFFRWLEAEAGEAVLPAWNFHKYLLDPAGELVGAWPSRVEPLSAEITQAIEAVLPDGGPA